MLFYLNDDLVSLNNGRNGFVSNVLMPDGSSDGRYSSNYATDNGAYLDTRLGAATETAYNNGVTLDLVGALPQLWTTAHLGNGIASICMRCQKLADARQELLVQFVAERTVALEQQAAALEAKRTALEQQQAVALATAKAAALEQQRVLLEQAVQDVLVARFPATPIVLGTVISELRDPQKLQELHHALLYVQ